MINLEYNIKKLEDDIINYFSYLKCYNETEDNIIDNELNNETCITIKYKSNLTDYEYNYNAIKIRTGLYYTKSAFENIMGLFNDLNYDNILNIKKYNDNEDLLNDKNILDIFNFSIYKLKEINNYSISLFEKNNSNFFKEILKIYSLDNDYSPFLKDYENILKLESQSFNNYFSSKFKFIDLILNKFNDTLYDDRNGYYIYIIKLQNISNEIFINFTQNIIDCFEVFKINQKLLNNSSYFIYSLQFYLSNIQNQKRIYYKNIINDFSKNYNYRLLNMTINLGEIMENLLKMEYEEKVFNHELEYIKIYDTYLNNFLNNMTDYITQIENNTLQKLENLYNKFMDHFNPNLTHIHNQNLGKIYNEFYANNSNKEKKRYNDKYENDYPILEEYKQKLNNFVEEISIIKANEYSENILYEYFKDNYFLEDYNRTYEEIFDLFINNFLNYEYLSLYINETQNPIYFDSLYNLLINNFNSSYKNYFNNYGELHLNYFVNKVMNEYIYYDKLLNNTKELGIDSLNCLKNLYSYLKNKLNNSIYYAINEHASFYLQIFYHKYKNIFAKNYITYYINQINEYNIEIYPLKDIIEEIIYDEKFNKTLNKLSSELMYDSIMIKLNNTLKEFLNKDLSKINDIIDNLDKKMNNILSNIINNEDNPNINIIIENYQFILSNHNNQFYFKLSNIPFDKLYIFIKGVLEPPLLKVKNKYNLIEKQILIGIINITDNFPDFSKITKEKLNIEDILEYIKLIIEELKITLLKYENDLNDDYDSCVNKLIHFTYINGLYTYDNPCYYSFCSINLDKNKDENKRNLEQISISKKKI